MQAAETGNAFTIPLGVPKQDVVLEGKLHQGSQGSVSEGRWRSCKVAIKKAKISTHADMIRFRAETQLLLYLGQHKNVVPLIGARLLPPGQMLSIREIGPPSPSLPPRPLPFSCVEVLLTKA